MDCLCCVNRGIGPASDTDFLGSLCKLKSDDGETAKFPAVPNRYLLYIVAGCPFAARPWTVLSFYGLTKAIPIIKCFPASFEHGWFLEPRSAGEQELVDAFPDAHVDKCPQGCHHLSQLYYKAKPDFKGAISVPLLWDTVEDTAVSNSSLGLAEMLATQMRHLGTRHQNVPLYPTQANEYKEHDELVKFLHAHVTTAVYQMNANNSGTRHDEMVNEYYSRLDEIQQRIDSNGPFLMGSNFYFCDIVLFISLVRLDLAYQWRFGLGRKSVRENYPVLWKYVQRIMDIPGIDETILPRDIMALYFMTLKFSHARSVPQVPQTWQDGIKQEYKP
jgi:putative glutathione S-transferase